MLLFWYLRVWRSLEIVKYREKRSIGICGASYQEILESVNQERTHVSPISSGLPGEIERKMLSTF